jgi:hypothetical protein
MRIVYFTDTYSPEINGVTNTLSRLGAYLDEKRVCHTVFAPAYEYEDTFPRRKNLHSPEKSLDMLIYAAAGLERRFPRKTALGFTGDGPCAEPFSDRYGFV